MPLKTTLNSDHSDNADVIVVLGAAVWAGGRPSPTLRRRVLHAVELLQCGHSDILILSGGVGKFPPSEARVMRRVAMSRGVARDKIIMEHFSYFGKKTK
jgi:vancomycin permeability regulator SanA